jgi:hypothetical protein
VERGEEDARTKDVVGVEVSGKSESEMSESSLKMDPPLFFIEDDWKLSRIVFRDRMHS